MTQHEHEDVIAFYEMHPISEGQILAKLKADGVDVSRLTEKTLSSHDQDHFGGIEANVALASSASISEADHVLDVCCGLGGPSRYLADALGCRVTGIDMTESRIEGARRLAKLTRLQHLVEFQVGNALRMPFADASFDVLISQEAFCHVPQKSRLLAECARVLAPGGRMAFTDVVATTSTPRATLERLEREMTYRDLATADDYISLLETVGFTISRVDDLGEEWRDILIERLAMYRSLEDQTVERFGRDHFSNWDNAYAYFVGRYQTGELSGTRITAIR